VGIEDKLLKLGAKAGDDVVIGDEEDAVVFDFDPQVQAGAEILTGPRGEDQRLDENNRRTSKQRREELAAQREYEADARAKREVGRVGEADGIGVTGEGADIDADRLND